MLDFADRHGIQPVTEIFSFDEVEDAVGHLRGGKAEHCVVLETETRAARPPVFGGG